MAGSLAVDDTIPRNRRGWRRPALAPALLADLVCGRACSQANRCVLMVPAVASGTFFSGPGSATPGSDELPNLRSVFDGVTHTARQEPGEHLTVVTVSQR